MMITDGTISIDLSQPQQTIDGQWYQELPAVEVQQITDESHPAIWALPEPPK